MRVRYDDVRLDRTEVGGIDELVWRQAVERYACGSHRRWVRG